MATWMRIAPTISRNCATVASKHGSEKSQRLWKRLSFFVAFPAIGLAMVNCYLNHKDHHDERPEFIPYDHMRVRTKSFPWGDGNHSLFHNSKTNALPDGYEE